MPSSREALAELLRRNEAEAVIEAAREGAKGTTPGGPGGASRGTVRTLTGLLYHEEELVRWRAVSMIGRLAEAEPELVRPVVSRLLWFMSEESGTVGWGSAQAIAEIYRRAPNVGGDAIRAVVHFMDDEELSGPANRNTCMLAGSIWAIGDLAEPGQAAIAKGISAEMIKLAAEMKEPLVKFLRDPDTQVRGLAAWALGRLRHDGARGELERLLDDGAVFQLYEDETLREVPVREAAASALKAI